MSNQRLITDFNAQLKHLEEMHSTSLRDWIDRALLGNSMPLYCGRLEPYELIVEYFRHGTSGEPSLQSKINSSLLKLIHGWSYQWKGPDYLETLLYLAVTFKLVDLYDYILGLAKSGKLKNVYPMRSSTSIGKDLHYQCLKVLNTLAKPNDRQLLSVFNRDIRDKDDGSASDYFGVCYGFLVKKNFSYFGKHLLTFTRLCLDGKLSFKDNILYIRQMWNHKLDDHNYFQKIISKELGGFSEEFLFYSSSLLESGFQMEQIAMIMCEIQGPAIEGVKDRARKVALMRSFCALPRTISLEKDITQIFYDALKKYNSYRISFADRALGIHSPYVQNELFT